MYVCCLCAARVGPCTLKTCARSPRHDSPQVCAEGPKEKLDTTAVSQPAIYVASLAAIEKIRAAEGQAVLDAVDVTCGLSLGEYTALTFAGARAAAGGRLGPVQGVPIFGAGGGCRRQVLEAPHGCSLTPKSTHTRHVARPRAQAPSPLRTA